LRKEHYDRKIWVAHYQGGSGIGDKIGYQNMGDFVKGLGEDCYLFTYKSMVDKNFDGLNNYLGFQVEEDAEVYMSIAKAKVVRKKAVGDWRHWFTEADVDLFAPAYLPYVEVIGYDCKDWLSAQILSL